MNHGSAIGNGAYPNNSGGIGNGAYPNNSGGIGNGAYYGVPPAKNPYSY